MAQSPKEHTMNKSTLLMGFLPFLLTACAMDNQQQIDPLSDRAHQKGKISIPLTAFSDSGIEYRLQSLALHLDGPEGSIDVEAQNNNSLHLTLLEGEWMMQVQDGWVLEKLVDGEYEPVSAEMTSVNPQFFEIVGLETTAVLIQFQTGEGSIDFLTGDLEISIEITEENELEEDPEPEFSCEERGLLTGDVTVHSQQEFNDFTEEYSSINGTLTVIGSDIDNIDRLACFTRLRFLTVEETNIESISLPPSVSIDRLELYNNPYMTHALLDIEKTGTITIQGNEQLVFLGSENLQELRGDLTVNQNPTLQSIDFPHLGYLSKLNINDNATLESVYLPSVEETANLFLHSNRLLQHVDLSGMTNAFHIGIADNVNLASLNMDALEYIGSGTYITNNDALEVLSLPSLERTAYILSIKNQPNLKEISLPRVTMIGEPISLSTESSHLEIMNNASLSDLNLSALILVGGRLKIHQNPLLEDLDSLNQLLSVREITVSSNANLNSIVGLSTLEEVRGNFNISFNPRLPNNMVQFVQELEIGAESIQGDVTILGNRALSLEEYPQQSCSGSYTAFENGHYFTAADQQIMSFSTTPTCPSHTTLTDGSVWEWDGECSCS